MTSSKRRSSLPESMSHRRTELSVDWRTNVVLPAPVNTSSDFDLYNVLPKPSRDGCRLRLPGRIADDPIIEPARALIVGENSCPMQAPGITFIEKES